MKKYDFNDSGIYADESFDCSLCGSNNISLLYIIGRFKYPFKIDRCNDCGFIFMNPEFNENIVKNLYNKDYYLGNAEYSYYDERKAEKYSKYVWDRRIKCIRRYVKSGNFLDIGSAFGGFLKSAEDCFIPYGIEFSSYAGKYSKQSIDNVHIGTLKDHPFKHQSFSVITMIEVIEHLNDPVPAIYECGKLLKDKGLLMIQTANMNALQAKIMKDNYGYFLPGHFSYFTKKNLSGLLKRAGFRKIKIFYPVDFGLIPKLLKSRYLFNSIWDYRKWVRIALYHFISKLHFKNFAVTSSMVVYAFK